MEMKIGICGILGRMGKEVARCAIEKNIEIALGIESERFKGTRLNQELGANYEIPIITSPAEMIKSDYKPDVIIDFSEKGVIIPYIEQVVERKKKIGFVIGTTGFSNDEIEKIKEFSKSIPIFLSYNMSRGINLILKILPQIRQEIPDFDVEIVEIHHKMKRDAPSGTALKLADSIDPNLKRIYGRQGFQPRENSEIGIFAVRGGDVVGEHRIYFLGESEVIEIVHRATSRKVFAIGALYASRLIYEKLKEGKTGFFTTFN